jgi:HEAT repeat protein
MLAPQTRHLCHLLAVWLLFCSGASAWAQSSTAERSLSQWRQDLVEAELDVRRETAIATRGCDLELQKQLVPEFIELLRYEKDGQIRLAVLDTVADMGPVAAEAIPALMVAMQKNFGGRQEEERHQDFRAALALSKIGPAAVEALRNLTGEKSANLRSEAALALGRIGPPAAAATAELIGLLADDDPHVRSDASTALGFLGPAAIKPLLIASRSEAAQVRTGAINSLGRCNAGEAQEDEVATACVEALKDSEPTVRAAAVRAIDARLAEEQVLQTALTEALQDAEKSVRVEVVNALAHRPRLLETLEPRLVQLLTADDDGVAWHAAFLLHLRGEAGAAALRGGLELEECRPAQIAQALALIGPPMVEPLTDALDDPQPRVRQAAALALGQIRPLNEETVSRLAQGLADENRDVQAAFLESISKLGSRARPAIAQIRARHADLDAQSRMRMIDVLIAAAPRDEQLTQELLAAVSDPDPRVQQHTIDAIRSTGTFGRPAVAVITEKLRSPDRQVQSAAAGFIGSQGRAAEEAVPHLIEMLDHPDAQWRIVIDRNTGRVRGNRAGRICPS